MKKEILNIILLLAFFVSYSQKKQTQLFPEFSLGQPVGAFSNENFNTKNGFGGGLHLERQNIWKVFGLGLYAGYHSYDTEYNSLFPVQLNEGGIQSTLYVNWNDFNWKSLQVALGPTVSFNLTNKLQLQGFTKAGIAKVSYPEYRYYVDVSSPTPEQFTLFEANTPKDAQSNLNFMMLSGFRFNYNFSKRFGVSIGANYTHIKGLTHTYTSRDLQITGNESPDILYENLINTPEQTKTYECNINTINGTIGIIINLGSNPDTPIDEPEDPILTEVPTETYNCSNVIYQAPGYNDYVVLSQTPYAVFEWTDENPRNLKEDKGYQLIFFIKENGQYQEVDRQIMKSKRRFRVGLNPNKSYPDNALYWQIVPLDSNQETFCPEPAKMMRLLVFKNKDEAIKRLPECLTQEESISPKRNTDFFQIKK